MNCRHLPAVLLTILTLATCARGQESIDAARAVIVREMPHLAPRIHLSLAAGSYAGQSDGFRISGHRGDIHVEAATVPTLLFGVNWYLKYVALMDVSTTGPQGRSLWRPCPPTKEWAVIKHPGVDDDLADSEDRRPGFSTEYQ